VNLEALGNDSRHLVWGLVFGYLDRVLFKSA
jgi:hypothetical protein